MIAVKHAAPHGWHHVRHQQDYHCCYFYFENGTATSLINYNFFFFFNYLGGGPVVRV